MAEEFRILIGAELKPGALDSIRNALKGITTKPISLQVNNREALSSIRQVQNELNRLRDTRINLNLNQRNANANNNNVNAQVQQAYNRLMQLRSSMNNAMVKMAGLDTSKDTAQIQVLEERLRRCTVAANQLYSQFRQDFSATQVQNLANSFEIAGDKIIDVRAKVTDLKRELANQNTQAFNQNFNFDNGKIENSLKRIKVASQEVKTALSDYKTAAANMQTAINTGNVDQIIAAYKRYQETLKTVNQQIQLNQQAEANAARAAKERVAAQKLEDAKKKLSSDMDAWLRQNSAAAKDYGAQIDVLKAKIQNCDASSLSHLRSEFQAITREAAAAGKNTQTFGDRLKSQIAKFSSYVTIATMFAYGRRVLTDMYNNVLQVDTAMTELYRVTDLSASQYSNLYAQMTNSAKQYGVALNDIIESTASWVRLGFDSQSAERLAELTAQYQHVTDLDNSTAVQNLVTAYKGFQSQLDTSFNGDATAAVERIADIYDKLGNEFATTAADVGTGLQKSAAVLSQAGNTIEESAGMVTGIQEVLQDAGVAGSTLKILTLRLRGMKGKLEELGEETDENVESVSKMQTQILNMTHGKVNIFEGTDFKSPYQIMSEISKIYNDLSDPDKANLLETIAGKNRSVGVAALIQNWENVEKATQAAYNAEGTAAKENEKYMNSMQGKLDATKASWQALSNTFLKSDFLKGLISSGGSLLNILDKVVGTLGTIPTILTAIAGFKGFKGNGLLNQLSGFYKSMKNPQKFDIGMWDIMRQGDKYSQYQKAVQSGRMSEDDAFTRYLSNQSKAVQDYAKQFGVLNGSKSGFVKQQKEMAVAALATNKSLGNVKSILTEYNTGLKNCGMGQKAFAQAVGQGNASLGKYLAGLNGAKASMSGYIASLVGAKAATLALSVASMALNMALTAGISMLVSKGFQAISDYVHKEELLIEKSEEAAQAVSEIQDGFSEKSNLVDEVGEKFAKLSKGIDSLTGKNISLNDEEYAEFLSISNQLAETFPTLSRHYDENGNAIVNLSGSVDTVVGSLKNLLDVEREIANQKILDQMPDIFNGAKAKSNANNGFGSTSPVKGGTGANQFTVKVDGSTQDFGKKIAPLMSEIQDAGYNVTWEHARNDNSNPGYKLTITVPKNQDVEDAKSQLRDMLSADDVIFGDLQKDIALGVEKGKEIWSSVVSGLSTYLDTNETYKTLGTDMQGVIQRMVGNIDYSSLDVNSWGELTNWIDKNVVDKIANLTPEVQEEFSNLFRIDPSNLSVDEYISEISKGIKHIADNSDFEPIDLEKLFGLDNYKGNVDKLASRLSQELSDSFNSGEGVELDNMVRKLVNSLNAADVDRAFDIATTFDYDSIEEFKSLLESDVFKVTVDIEAEKSDFEAIFDKSKGAITESNGAIGLAAESISTLESRYKSLESYDPSKLFEKTTNGIHINRKALQELEQEYENQKKSSLASQLEEYQDQYDKLRAKIENTTDATERAALINKQNSLAQQINETSQLISMYDGLTSAYNKWINAQETPDENAGYAAIGDAYADMKAKVEEGWYGNDELNAYLDLLLNVEQRTGDAAADFAKLKQTIDGTNHSLMDYWKYETKDNKEVLVTDGLFDFLDDVNKKLGDSYAKVEDGIYSFDFSGDKIEDVAKAFGTTTEVIEQFARAMGEAGMAVNLDGLNIENTEGIENGIERIRNKLKELGEEPVEIKLQGNTESTIDEQIDHAKSLLDSLKNEDGTIKVGFSESDLTYAISAIASLNQQKAVLEAPAVMSVSIDTSGVMTDTEAAIDTLQRYKQAVADMQTMQAAGLDTSEAQRKVQELAGEIQNLPSDVKANLNLNTESVQTALDGITGATISADAQLNPESIAAINTAINGITPEVLVTAGIDASKVTGYNPENKNAKVTYTVDDKKVKSYSPPGKSAKATYTASMKSWTPPTKYGTVYYTAKPAPGSGKGTFPANGSASKYSAFARGTAFAHGSWATGKSGIALGGELGQELVIRNGKFFTIGDDSPEFFKYQPNDINK